MYLRRFLQSCGVLSFATLPLTTWVMSPVAIAALPSQSHTWAGVSQTSLSFWNNARNANPPVPPAPGGGRGDTICLLAPVQFDGDRLADAAVWGDRPFFLWRGSLARIEVTTSRDEVIWHTTTWESLTPDVYTRLYDGPPLQREVRYEWKAYRVYVESAPSATFTIPFQLMSESNRQELSGELSAFDVILDAEQVPIEQRPLSYISFLAERGLWAEALRITFTAQPSSEALERYQQRVLETCD